MDAIGNLLYGTMFTNHFVGRAVSLNEQYKSLLEILLRGLLSERECSATKMAAAEPKQQEST